MASYTANYNLRKDASTEKYDVAVVNQNLDEIDAQMHQNEVASTTPFLGASSSMNGEKGIVPRPMTGDENKVLYGDGTWKPVQGGGGASAVSDLTDVDLTNLADGQILKYNETSQKWENANESGGGGGGGIITVDRTDNTSQFAWLQPCDANGNPLKPSEVTILSIVGKADMSGAPPYNNGLNLCVDSASDIYICKLYNTQTGAYVQNGVYSVNYRVTYIPYGGNS